MKSRREIHNEELFFQAKTIETEYYEKILKLLLQYVGDNKITESELYAITGFQFAVSLNKHCVDIHNYNDKNNRDDFKDMLYLAKGFINKEWLDKLWTAVEALYCEGTKKINALGYQVIMPKKFLTVDNFETQEEYNKVHRRCVDRFLETDLDVKDFGKFTNNIDIRAKSLGLLTMKEQVRESETPADKRAKMKARKYYNDCIKSGKEVDYDYMQGS